MYSTKVLAQPVIYSSQVFVKKVDASTNPLVDSVVMPLQGDNVKIIRSSIKSNRKHNSNSFGTFNAIGSAIAPNFNKGILLTTGFVEKVVEVSWGDPRESIPKGDTSTNQNYWRKNVYRGIDYIINKDRLIISATQDYCAIEFDFIPYSDSINLNIIYGTVLGTGTTYAYDCTVGLNAMACFLKGQGIPNDAGLLALDTSFSNTKNIALIPCTNKDIQFGTFVNDTFPANYNNLVPPLLVFCPESSPNICTGQGFVNHWKYFRSLRNYNDINGEKIINYNSITKELPLKIKVEKCKKYTLTVIIAEISGIYH